MELTLEREYGEWREVLFNLGVLRRAIFRETVSVFL